MSGRIQQQFKKQLIRFFNQHPGKIFKARTLSREFGVQNRDYRLFRQMLKSMAEEGQISRHKGNQYGQYVKPIFATGKLLVKPQGYGFLVREDGGEDIFISQKNMGSALHGDRVEAQVWAHQAGKLPEGKVRNILDRGRERLVGIFMEAHAYNYLIPDDFKINRDIYLDPENSLTAKPGQKVVAEIVDWGDAARMPEGQVVEVLGYPDEPGVDTLSVARGFDLQDDFSEQVEAEASLEFRELPNEIARRIDYREKLIFTIDPADAKDFDDAVSLISLENGHIQLGVHIADVSYYVPIESAVDKEAMSRGTSVYLVDHVIPMLPERLSNELCSLKPRSDKLTYSVIMELTSDGDLIDYQIHESVIRSQYRLSYEQVHQLLGLKAEELESTMDEWKAILQTDHEGLMALWQNLKQMHGFSRRLFDRWRDEGSIDFDAPEPLVQLDNAGKPLALGVRPRYDSHRLIEAFMLLANRTVAGHVHKLRQTTKLKLPFIYRVHQKPSEEKLQKFTDFVRAFGYVFDPGKKVTPKKFQRFLDGIQDPRHKTVIDEVAIRTMMKASYTTANLGHFGLAFKEYTHFTSPIRRYPDLMVHRLLKAYQMPIPQKLQIRHTLAQIAAQATEREIIAQEAERESIRAKQMEFMMDHLGMEFDGVISGVTAFGFFVEIPEFLVEGLVAVRDLMDDYYVFDEKRLQLKGERTRNVYRLGDTVRVSVARIHREMRKLDFILVNQEKSKFKVRNKKKMIRRRVK